MNFLAHLYLSGADEKLKIGNFIADSVKGSSFNKYPAGIARGITLHRAIDHFSDTHPIFLKSVERLRPNYKKYAGVLVDIFYDHFLAKNWKEYSDISLSQYSKQAYKLMLKNALLMPAKSMMFLRYAIRTNRLESYANLQGIEEVLYGMSRRTTFKSNMELAGKELKQYYSQFETEFKEFFTEIQMFVKEWIENNPESNELV